jgi:hypothetical protein
MKRPGRRYWVTRPGADDSSPNPVRAGSVRRGSARPGFGRPGSGRPSPGRSGSGRSGSGRPGDGLYDLDAMARDDRLVDALGEGEVIAEPGGDVVSQLLSGWRSEIDSAPVVLTSVSRRLGRRRVAGALVLAMALSLGGFSAAAAEAQPGSRLWPLTQLVASERASSQEAAQAAKEALSHAEDAVTRQHGVEARRYLDAAERYARKVRPRDGAAGLHSRAAKVRRDLAHVPAVPPTPAPASSSSTGETVPAPAATSRPSRSPSRGDHRRPPPPVIPRASTSSQSSTPAPPPTDSPSVPAPLTPAPSVTVPPTPTPPTPAPPTSTRTTSTRTTSVQVPPSQSTAIHRVTVVDAPG